MVINHLQVLGAHPPSMANKRERVSSPKSPESNRCKFTKKISPFRIPFFEQIRVQKFPGSPNTNKHKPHHCCIQYIYIYIVLNISYIFKQQNLFIFLQSRGQSFASNRAICRFNPPQAQPARIRWLSCPRTPNV